MLKNRLLAIGAVMLLAGISIPIYIGGSFAPLFVVAVSVLCVFLCTVRFFKQKIHYAVAFSAILVAGAVYVLLYRDIFILPYSAFDGKPDVVTGTVTDISASGCDITVTASEIGIPDATRIRLFTENAPDIGDSLTFTGILSYAGAKPELCAADIRLYSFPTSSEATEGSGILHILRNKAYSVYDTLGDRYADFLKSVVFNDKSGLSDERYTMYRNAGAAAYFAVSGLHVSFAVMSVFGILRYLGVHKVIRGIIATLIALIYGVLVGFSPSVTRAIIMVMFVIAADIFTVESDTLTSLFFALTLLLLANPFSVASLSLRLSFAATLGVLYSTRIRPFGKKHPVLSSLYGIFVLPVITSVACFAFTLPLMLLSFDVVSLISPLSNVILGMIFSPLLLLAFLLTLLAFCGLPLFSAITIPLKFLISLFDAVCDMMSGRFRLLLPTVSPYAVIASVVAIVSIAVVLAAPKKTRRIAFASSCAVIAVLVSIGVYTVRYGNNNVIRATYNEGIYGYSVAAVCNGERIFVDCGAGFDSGFVYSCGITDIDTYVAVKYTAKTAESIDYAAKRFGVGKIVLLDENCTFYDMLPNSCTIKVENEYVFGNLNRGITLDKNNIYLYRDMTLAAITSDGILPDDITPDVIVFRNTPVLSHKQALTAKLYSTADLTYGDTVTIDVLSSERIEVKEHES